jgi:hypothetical protein
VARPRGFEPLTFAFAGQRSRDDDPVQHVAFGVRPEIPRKVVGGRYQIDRFTLAPIWPALVLVHPSGIEGLIFLARGQRYPARGFPA